MSARTICQVIHYDGLTRGSFIPAMESLASSLRNRGDRCVVFARRVPGATWPKDLIAAGATLNLVASGREVVEGLRRLRPDIVHAHFSRFDLQALRGAPRARVFWHVHSVRHNHSPAARAKAFVKYRVIGAPVEAIVAVSQSLADECVTWYAPPRRMRVVENGIDTRHFRPPAAAERAEARARLHIARDERVALFFERDPLKGGATLREALRSARGFRLLVVGGTQEERDRFGGLPSVLSMERVAEVRQLYWAADVLAFPSHREAFGLVLTEALACGLPVAASDIPAVREICGGLDTVAMFPPRDGAAMARALERAVARRDGGAGRQRVRARFGLDRWTAEMLRLYDSPGG
ncbi:MAG: glycosyltransferase family 4 protein [bacterium]|nr:glycosyltransferase family 4 protein [bacterium]